MAPAWNISYSEMCQSPGATTPPPGLLNAEAPGSLTSESGARERSPVNEDNRRIDLSEKRFLGWVT